MQHQLLVERRKTTAKEVSMLLSKMFNLQKDLEQLFGLEYSPNATYGRRSFPAVNLFESDEKLIMKCELPGISKENLHLCVENDVLNLKGGINQDQKNDVKFHRQERIVGNFERSIKLPYKVDSEKVSAKLENGILSVTLEREESSKPRSIQIN